MLSLATAACIDDLRAIAARRLPGFAFDFLDGGAESETNLRRNRTAFENIALVPRYLTGAAHPCLTTPLFDKDYAVPLGMAPIGFLNMAWPGADLAFATLAARENIPHIISTASSTRLETLATAAGGNAWFQMYVSHQASIVNMLLQRITAAGIEVLVVTVDVPQTGKRDRDIRNQLQIPFRLTPKILSELIRHPRWSIGTLMVGAPRMANFTEVDSPTGVSRSLADIQRLMISQDFSWDDFQQLRDRWKGVLLIKGILHPDDAIHAVDAGCDGIIVSNHGGRQLDCGPASIDALPAIAAVVQQKVPLILDSGVRRGADIIRAKALGASFVLAGRAFAYGAASGGEAGVHRAFGILETELRRCLGQLGKHDFAGVDSSILHMPHGIGGQGALPEPVK